MEKQEYYAKPFDKILSDYMREHKSIGSNERRVITDNAYLLIRNYIYLQRKHNNNIDSMISNLKTDLIKEINDSE